MLNQSMHQSNKTQTKGNSKINLSKQTVIFSKQCQRSNGKIQTRRLGNVPSMDWLLWVIWKNILDNVQTFSKIQITNAITSISIIWIFLSLSKNY